MLMIYRIMLFETSNNIAVLRARMHHIPESKPGKQENINDLINCLINNMMKISSI